MESSDARICDGAYKLVIGLGSRRSVIVGVSAHMRSENLAVVEVVEVELIKPRLCLNIGAAMAQVAQALFRHWIEELRDKLACFAREEVRDFVLESRDLGVNFELRLALMRENEWSNAALCWNERGTGAEHEVPRHKRAVIGQHVQGTR